MNSLTENDLFGPLETFKSDVLNRCSQPKEKSLAFEAQMIKPNDEREGDDETGSINEDELALLAQNLNRYLRSSRNEQTSSRPNGS